MPGIKGSLSPATEAMLTTFVASLKLWTLFPITQSETDSSLISISLSEQGVKVQCSLTPAKQQFTALSHYLTANSWLHYLAI